MARPPRDPDAPWKESLGSDPRGSSTVWRRVFTDYVRTLDTFGDPPDDQSLIPVLQSLGTLLISELRRRGLWDQPPSFLGIFGSSRWAVSVDDRASAAWPGAAGFGPALEELIAECYAFVFIIRLRSIRAQLEFKQNIDGLVLLNVRHFLHDRQKRHDPLGFRVYGVLRSAVRALIASGDLSVVRGDPGVRNATLLAFPGRPASPLEGQGLSQRVAGWCDFLLPDLVTATGRRRKKVQSRLMEEVVELGKAGFGALHFKDLAAPLKTEVRSRWAALFEPDPEESGVESGVGDLVHLVRTSSPSAEYEEQQWFWKVAECVEESIWKMPVRQQKKRYLSVLWQFLVSWVAASEWPSDSARAAAPELGALPSRRRLARLLDIPRRRMPELYSSLSSIFLKCNTVNKWKYLL